MNILIGDGAASQSMQLMSEVSAPTTNSATTAPSDDDSACRDIVALLPFFATDIIQPLDLLGASPEESVKGSDREEDRLS